MRRLIILLLLTVSASALFLAPSAWSRTEEGVFVQPAELKIGTFFSGSTVKISGEVPAGRDVIVKIIGETQRQKFDIKGRVGPFWMTRDKTELDGAPAMYIVLLPKGREWNEGAASPDLGLKNLKSEITLSSGAAVPDDLFEMFLQLKKGEGLYEVQQDAVTYASGKGGRRRFEAVYRFPRSTAVGEYTIVATTVDEANQKKNLSTHFSVTEVGFVRLVDELATDRRLIYGVAAVVIALFTGALMGLLFKGGGSH